MLEVSGLAKRYGGFEFGPVDLTVEEEVFAVLGPSGSGKTTLLSTLAGIETPDAGSVTLDDRALVGSPVEGRRLGLVFQDGALFPHMSARENVAYAAASPDRILHLAELLEIEDVLGRRPKALSGGERQRVALARTLAADPDALLLDEPLSSLDTPIRRRLRDHLHDLFDSLSIPIIYVTHDQRGATTLGDRIAVLRDGTIEHVGTPSEVLYRPASRFVARFTGTENVFEATVLERTDGDVRLQFGDRTLRVRAEQVGDSPVTACIHPSRVRIVPAEADSNDSGDGNTYAGTVRRCLNEGETYRVVVALDDEDGDIVATVSPGAVAKQGLDSAQSVRVSLPSDAVHLI